MNTTSENVATKPTGPAPLSKTLAALIGMSMPGGLNAQDPLLVVDGGTLPETTVYSGAKDFFEPTDASVDVAERNLKEMSTPPEEVTDTESQQVAHAMARLLDVIHLVGEGEYDAARLVAVVGCLKGALVPRGTDYSFAWDCPDRFTVIDGNDLLIDLKENRTPFPNDPDGPRYAFHLRGYQIKSNVVHITIDLVRGDEVIPTELSVVFNPADKIHLHDWHERTLERSDLAPFEQADVASIIVGANEQGETKDMDATTLRLCAQALARLKADMSPGVSIGELLIKVQNQYEFYCEEPIAMYVYIFQGGDFHYLEQDFRLGKYGSIVGNIPETNIRIGEDRTFVRSGNSFSIDLVHKDDPEKSGGRLVFSVHPKNLEDGTWTRGIIHTKK